MIYEAVYNKMSDKDKTDEFQLEVKKSPISARKAKKLTKLKEYLSKQEKKKNASKVSSILKKNEDDRTEEEKKVLTENVEIVQRIHKNKERRLLSEQRVLETEDTEQVLQQKCQLLAKEILQSKQTVIYTGAGISTAASIPDYRGPQGVWTLLQKGEQLVAQDLSDAEPTLTHMCITALQQRGHVSHVVSQNCDGLHLRSGLPRKILSEVHGNMYIEICYDCKPHREYIRLFDVTEKTGVRRHFTGRACKKCGGKLQDTIVHFGEKGRIKSPYRWKEAVKAAKKCDLILCLGSSLKILKKYSCLWCMDRAVSKRPKLAIVNLQWTPKDSNSFLKVNGKCDDVLERVMKILQYDIPKYSRETDPIFQEAITLENKEASSMSKKVLEIPDCLKDAAPRKIPRSRTPSVSSDSSDSDSTDITESSSDDDSDSTNTDTDDVVIISDSESSNDKILSKQEQMAAYVNGRKFESSASTMSISSIISKVKNRVQSDLEAKRPITKEEALIAAFQEKPSNCSLKQAAVTRFSSKSDNILKSEKICNEAKLAMQLKSNTADADNKVLTKEEACIMKSEQICNDAKKAMQQKSNPGFVDNNSATQTNTSAKSAPGHTLFQPWDTNKNGYHKDANSSNQKVHHSINSKPSNTENKQVDLTYEDKLKYLQTLQSQLQALKQTQQILKQRETGHQSSSGKQNVHSQTPLSPKWYASPVDTQLLGHNTHPEIHIKTEQHTEPVYMSGDVVYTQKQLEEFMTQQQKEHNKWIETQNKKFEKEKSEMKLRQENDHRRVYQQFVIQVQVAEQTNVSDQKKSEMFQIFQSQQKLMVSKQTAELQDLFHKHQQEQKTLTEKIKKKQKENGAFLESLQIVSPSKLPTPSMYTSPKQTVNMTGHSAQYNQSSPFPVMLSPGRNSAMISSPPGLVTPQHMITNFWHDPTAMSMHEQPSKKLQDRHRNKSAGKSTHNKQNRQNQVKKQATVTNQVEDTTAGISLHTETKIPGFNELVEGIISCETCLFLKTYGIGKRTCAQCDSLKMKYGIAHNSVQGSAAQSFLKSEVQNAMAMEQFQQYVASNLKTEQNPDVINQYMQIGINVEQPVPVGPAYLNVAQNSGQGHHQGQVGVQTLGQTDTTGQYLNHLSHATPTSTSTTGLLACPETSDQELSPVIPYAVSNSDEISTSSDVIISTDANLPVRINDDHSATPSAVDNLDSINLLPDSNIISEIIESLDANKSVGKHNLKPDNAVANSALLVTQSDLNASTNSTIHIAQSDLKADNSVAIMDETSIIATESPAFKSMTEEEKHDKIVLEKPKTPFRPRSQSVLTTNDVTEEKESAEKKVIRSHSTSEVAVAGESEKSEVVADTEVTAAKLSKKRKSSTNVSIPGWFGKGLNLKKRRK